MFRSLAAALFAVFAAVACGGNQLDLERDGPSTVEDARTIEPSKFAEGEFDLTPGASITVEFSTGGTPVTWNLHTHDDDQTQNLHQGESAADRYEYTATKAGHYWPMWENKSTAEVTLTVEITLGEGARWNGWL